MGHPVYTKYQRFDEIKSKCDLEYDCSKYIIDVLHITKIYKKPLIQEIQAPLASSFQIIKQFIVFLRDEDNFLLNSPIIQ